MENPNSQIVHSKKKYYLKIEKTDKIILSLFKWIATIYRDILNEERERGKKVVR